MSVDRRYFLKGIMGSGFIALTSLSTKPTIETVEGRIQRLFSLSSAMNIKPSSLPPHRDDHSLKLRDSDDDLLKVSDKTFVKMIDKNIRHDFTEGHIANLAGWQVSHTELTLLAIIRRPV